MGLKREYLNYIEECVTATIGTLHQKRMLELGNQYVLGNFIPEKTGKEYFENRGVSHISVDLNGLDNSLMLDVSKPRQFTQWHNYFDIITNSGTSEHVEPKSAQYACFAIMHNCLKEGGVTIHLVPDINELERTGYRKGHCNHYYSRDFFIMLAEENNSKLVSLKMMDGLICACLQKKTVLPFMTNRKKLLAYITRKEGGYVYTGINKRRFLHFGYFIRKLRKILSVAFTFFT